MIHDDRHLDRVERRVGRLVRGKSHPDPDTGMSMPERSFLAAMKSGAHLGSSTADPAADAVADDAHAQRRRPEGDLRVLKTLAPVKNKVPDPIPPAK